MTAVDYVLGILDADRREAFQQVLKVDPKAVAEVEAWRKWLSPLDAIAPDVSPPATMWRRIEAATEPEAANDRSV